MHSRPMAGKRRVRNNLIIWAVVAIVGISCLVRVGLPALDGAPRPAASTTSTGGSVAVFFTSSELVYPDVARNRTPPAAERALLADIEAARRSIDAALYEYNLDSVAEALARAQRRGVRVRLALDRENLDEPEMAKWAGVVEQVGIPISWQDSNAFLHSKFVIVDERLVWTGSWNATTNDTYRNNNNLLRISVAPLVQNYLVEFAEMAEGSFSNDKQAQTPNPQVRLGAATIENYFAPREPVQPHVVAAIERAQRSVEFLAFSYTDDATAEAMLARQRAGVTVRGVMENRNAEGTGSEYGRLRQNGAAVFTDGNCYTMHHKVIIVDERVVIAGSYNFTGRAEEINDENLLIIDDPLIAQAYHEEFERVYRQAQSPLRCG